MTNVYALRKERNDLKAEASQLVEKAIANKTDLEGTDLKKYNDLIDDLKSVEEQIFAHAAGATFEDASSSFLQPQASSRSVSASSGGLKSQLREVYASANNSQRKEIDNLAAYVGGDIRAAADLRPNSDGGFTIPSFIVPVLERAFTSFAPVVSVARTWPTETGADLTFPVFSDSESAVQLDSSAATGADATVSGDTPPTSLTGPTLKAWKVSSKPIFVPRETFTDSPIDLINEIVGALLARIVRFENLKYTRGVGGTEAEGFLTNATKYVTGAVALDLDICLDLAYNVPQLYRPQGVYMMSDTTAKYLRKLKTGISGDKQQLWADADATKGTPASLHGYPVIINNDMDSVSADGTFASKNPVSFGDMSKFVIRQAENNQPYAYRYQVPARDGAAVILFRRSDSKLIVPAAISKVAVS